MNMMYGSKAEPLTQWVDCWPRDKFDKPHMEAYKAFDIAGSIRIQKVIYSKSEQKVAVVFLTSFPIEWLHEEMKRMLEDDSGKKAEDNTRCNQIQMGLLPPLP